MTYELCDFADVRTDSETGACSGVRVRPRRLGSARLDVPPARFLARLERGGQQSRVAGLGAVVEVLHGGLQVGVAHPRLDLDDRCLFDGDRAEGVAQIVKRSLRSAVFSSAFFHRLLRLLPPCADAAFERSPLRVPGERDERRRRRGHPSPLVTAG